MKILSRIIGIVILMVLFAPQNISAQKAKSPLSYNVFYKKDTTKIDRGYYSIYNKDDKYYLEIPNEGLNKDVLISTQAIKGYSSYISPASGVVRFSKGRNNMIEMTRNMLNETTADTADVCMISAVRKSGLMPVSNVFPIVAYGKDNKSVIIDLTSELNNAGGIFAVNSSSLLSHPDPSRSGVESYRTIERGAAFMVKRSQTDYQKNPTTQRGVDIAQTFMLEMVLQELPQHEVVLKPNHQAYGFNTFSISEYDTKKYSTFKRDYIQRWCLDASAKDLRKQKKGLAIEPQTQICIYIDPVTPKPFVASIKEGVEAWNASFLKAGWKNVFRISSDEKDGSLSYKKILFRWISAFNDNNTSMITNPSNGEILCARINLMDFKADELLHRYFLQCGDKDPRILKDIRSLDIRKEILTVQVEALMADVLGLKPNKAASTVFTPDNLRSDKWLDVYGTSASITSQFTFNYVARPEDKISARNLMPRISVYDNDAIAYAYGNSTAAPTLKASYYADLNKTDPYAQDFLSNNILEASAAGLSSIATVYPQIYKLVGQLPEDQNDWALVSTLAKKALILRHAYMNQIASLVGGYSKRAIIPKLNETLVVYVPKAEQIKALDYLEKNLLTSLPDWAKNDSMNMAAAVSLKEHALMITKDVAGLLINKNAVGSLIDAEISMGSKAFTCNDLFSSLDRIIFAGFDNQKQFTPYQRSVQACFIDKLISEVASSNITSGLNDNSVVLHAYFIKTANKIKILAETHTDPACRENFQLMVIKMNRGYFDK